MANCIKYNNSTNDKLDAMRIMVINFFVSKGLTPMQACAICGSIQQESSLNPTATNPSSKAYGLFQFLGNRKDRLITFARQKEKPYSDANIQLEYAWHELMTTENRAYNLFKPTGKTLKDYVEIWTTKFERCGPAEVLLNRRYGFAKVAAELYNKLQKGECSISITENSVSYNYTNDYDLAERFPECQPEFLNVLKSLYGSTATPQPNGKRGSGKIVMIGDSWAYGMSKFLPSYGGESIGISSSGLSDKTAKHRGFKPADQQISEYLSTHDPKYIILYSGLNDLGIVFSRNNITESGRQKVIDGLNSIIAACNGYQLYMVSYMYTNHDSIKDRSIDALCDCMKSVCSQNSTTAYVNLEDVRSAFRNQYVSGLDANGNGCFHPKGDGYQALVKAIFERIPSSVNGGQPSESGEYNDGNGFSINEISDELWKSMKNIRGNVGKSDLRLVKTKYYKSPHKQNLADGGVIVNKEIAEITMSAFKELYKIGFPIANMDYNSLVKCKHDTDIMDKNGTTGFFYRKVTGGTSLSKHASGMAIDINPKNNMYKNGQNIQPSGATYNSGSDPYCVGYMHNGTTAKDVLKGFGFKWGGDWNNPKDYQHFQK